MDNFPVFRRSQGNGNSSIHPFIANGAFLTGDDCTNTTMMPDWTTYQLYRIIIDVVVVGLFCLLGFVGNSITIVILWSDQDKKSTTNWLLQSLAVVDIVYLVACIFIQPLKTVSESTTWFGPEFRGKFIYVELYVWTFASVAQMITVWIVVLVTVDRYIAICHPLRSKMRTLERAHVAVAAVVAVAFLYNIPLVFERRVSDALTHCDAGRGVSSHLVRTEFRRSETYFVVYKTICYFVFRSVGPLLILIILNAKLMQALREMRRRHRYMTRSHRQRENVTLTLIVVVSVFIICEIPDATLRVYMAVTLLELSPPMLDGAELDGHVISGHVILAVVNPVVNALLTFNSSVNFLIYCLVGNKFRRILARMCTRVCHGGNGMTCGGGGGCDGPELRLCNNPTISQSQTGNSYALTNILSNGPTDALNNQHVNSGGIHL